MNDGEKVVISKIRPGDQVSLVPLEVAAVNNLRNEIAAYVGDRYRFFPADQIAAHHPAPREFHVGDRVTKGKYPDEWVIEHIAYGRAWLSRNDGQEGWLWPLDDLTLVEGGE